MKTSELRNIIREEIAKLDYLNESSDIDVAKLSDGMLKEIRNVFNGVKHGLSNNDLQLLAKIAMEIKKRGLK